MKLPVVKILWGMFAFPSMYPGRTFRAVGVPLIGIIGIALLWAGQRGGDAFSASTWALILLNWLLLAWLAVRTHRAVLIDEREHDSASPPQAVASYLAAIVLGELLFSVFMALASIRYVPSQGGAPTTGAMTGLPQWIALPLQIVPLYLLARVSPMLPAIALGHGWRVGDSWRLSRRNGWRLFLVVCLLPWLLHGLVGIAYASMASAFAMGILAVLNSLVTALAIMALSLAYRELTAAPAPPPTTPPA